MNAPELDQWAACIARRGTVTVGEADAFAEAVAADAAKEQTRRHAHHGYGRPQFSLTR